MTTENLRGIARSLDQANLVPGPAEGIIPHEFNPLTELQVAFDGKLVNLGNLFRTSECKSTPDISFTPEVDATANTSYLIMLIDPDAPTPDDPKFAFWRHWIHSGIQIAEGKQNFISINQTALTEYLGPGPKDDSQPHRYLFLLFREPVGLSLSKKDVGGEEFVQRRTFDPLSFIKSHKLTLVGLNWMLGAGDGWKA